MGIRRFNPMFDTMTNGPWDPFKVMPYQQEEMKEKKRSEPEYNIKEIVRNEEGYDSYVYEIEVALPGCTKDHVRIRQTEKALLVESNYVKSNKNDDDEEKYLVKGINFQKSFALEFALMHNLEVVEASMENGMLKITVKRHYPDKTSKHVPIS